LWIAVSAVALAAITDTSATPRPRAHIDKAVEAALTNGDAPTRLIVRVDPTSRAALKNTWRQQRHAIHHEHALVSALTIEVPAAAIDGIARMPGVLSVSIDAPLESEAVKVNTKTVTTVVTYQSFIQQMLGSSASGATGAGVGVAIVDSGISPTADFGTRIRGFYDFTQSGIATTPYDDYGHGTHVASLVGGNGALSQNLYSGVAPGTSLIGLKVLDGTGGGYTSNVIAAIEFAITNKTALGIDVINLSLGHPPYESATTDPLVAAVDRASAAGNRRRRVRRQRGNQSDDWCRRLRRHSLAPQRTLGDYRWRGRHDADARSERRPGDALQLARTVVVRRPRQTRRGGARSQDDRHRGTWQHAAAAARESADARPDRHLQLPAAHRHQHGGGRDVRCGGARSRGQPDRVSVEHGAAHAERRQSLAAVHRVLHARRAPENLIWGERALG
jgi:hypothetical protein